MTSLLHWLSWAPRSPSACLSSSNIRTVRALRFSVYTQRSRACSDPPDAAAPQPHGAKNNPVTGGSAFFKVIAILCAVFWTLQWWYLAPDWQTLRGYLCQTRCEGKYGRLKFNTSPQDDINMESLIGSRLSSVLWKPDQAFNLEAPRPSVAVWIKSRQKSPPYRYSSPRPWKEEQTKATNPTLCHVKEGGACATLKSFPICCS